jgi:AraC family transcriptional regulator, transcriptional activator of pobA
MVNVILPFNWRAELDNLGEFDAIDTDFVLLDNIFHSKAIDYPFKLDVTICMVTTKGTSSGNINLKPFTSSSPGLTIIVPDQILEHGYVSDDLSGFVIIMSRKFTESLNFQEGLPLFLSIRENPFIPLEEDDLNTLLTYFSLLRTAVRKKENPFRMKVVKHLVKVFFYSPNYQYHKLSIGDNKSKNETLMKSFLVHVQANYKEQRGMEFYADKLCLTPKYLSKVIKENSGMSASEWIDSYVVLEAKALLKSTNKTIQQISDELNFPSQSFFGKYFKRQTGVSPKEYKKG